MNKANIKGTLKSSEFFGAFSSPVLDILVEAMDSMSVGAGERLFAKGDQGDCMFATSCSISPASPL